MKTVTDRMYYKQDGISCVFDLQTGRLLSVSNENMNVDTNGLFLDVGIDEQYQLGFLSYHSLDGRNTWELPPIQLNVPNRKTPRFLGHTEKDGQIKMYYRYSGLDVTVCYRVAMGTLEIDAEIKNTESKKRLVNGVAFVFNHECSDGIGELLFEYPGNVPHQVFKAEQLNTSEAVETGLVNSVIHASIHENHYNLLFVDEEEKWATAVIKESDHSVMYVQNAAVECELEADDSINVGTLYVQLIGEGDAYGAVRKLYERKGWCPPADGMTDGVLYSCHPHGTMDAGFPDRLTMREYADELPALKAMGIDHLWVLPIFEHLDRGVYHPTDQAIIDPRYGTEEDVRYFSQKAHELGMTLLFDYVPHGPEIDDPLGKKYRSWASEDREGNPVIEWNCLSFDMANPEYQHYIYELVQNHVERFDIDGSRIDCAMGGLTNFRPYSGNRPSSSNLKGGVAISKTIRAAIRDMGKKPLVTPENFNPVPAYAPYSDVFYDMALYRVLFELCEEGAGPETMANRLRHWLDTEMKCTPKGYLKLRFLGNHDTVTWVWHSKRATEIFGTELAKALWVLMSTIDGIPMIYQGDECASIYRGSGPNLIRFFSELFAARKNFLGNNYDISYMDTDGPIIAYTRKNGCQARLVAVNLSSEPASFTVESADALGENLYGYSTRSGELLQLSGYGYAILDKNDSG